ncbi:MAG: cob(I)yrinic acid a,c-diamide adenosyltransferase [Desulfobacterales bacterium]|nr:cob(I)yrinic acid a,c-diamide adenosyltransferase [Desulfobacterales bacterium]MDX2511832.1 cob(I)yrinic acid a,c-diamide adenosyltransferase [Desulfobacterales bacterium]
MKGYLQVYTGNGKGKTTAALGLSLRAAGAGMKVYIAQFLKQGDYSEIKALERFSDAIVLEQFGLGQFVKGKPTQTEINTARNGLEKARQQLSSGDYDVVILEEANIAVAVGLFSVKDLMDVIQQKPDHVELVITGRNAAPEVIEKADLVTEMKAVKHYYDQGVQARIGIEK